MDTLLYIERGLEYNQRRNWGRLLFIWSILFLSLAVTSLILGLPQIYSSVLEVIFIIFLLIYISNGIMKIIFLHHYKESMLKEDGISYEALKLRDKIRKHKDDVSGLINSSYGDQIMKRLGVRRASLEQYLDKRKHQKHIKRIEFSQEGLDLQQYVLLIYDNDEHFSSYLKTQRVLRDDVVHAALLVQNISVLEKEGDRFWSNLPLHKLSPFEYDALNIEKMHNIFLTTPVFRRLSVLDDEEKFKMFRSIIYKAKKHNRKNVLISDLAIPQ